MRARRLSRLFTGLAVVTVCFGLFGVVFVHVLLAQGQGEVEQLSTQAQQLEEQQQRLRLQLAELGSPNRIVEAARSRLGMVTPSTVVPLAPATLADPPATTIPAPSTSTTIAKTATTIAATTTETESAPSSTTRP